MPEAKIVPAEESKDTKTVETKTESKETNEDVKVGDVLKTTKEEPKKETKMVPESVLIEYKKESKEVRKELDALKKSIESGATKKEVSTDIKDLAEKHGVDAEFLNDFAHAVRKEANEDTEEKISSIKKPIEEKENAEKREKSFNEHYEKTLEELPEFKKLVNKDVIKALAFDPKNANKTFAQIFQDSYGHLVTGKKTLEPTKARGGAKDTEIDFKRASSDTEYFKEIMADPQLKKKYNEDIATRNRF